MILYLFPTTNDYLNHCLWKLQLKARTFHSIISITAATKRRVSSAFGPRPPSFKFSLSILEALNLPPSAKFFSSPRRLPPFNLSCPFKIPGKDLRYQ